MVVSYFHFFGCKVVNNPGKAEEDLPWQCPFQLGECTGQFVGWIDESLYKMTSLLRLALKSESRKLQKRKDFVSNFNELEIILRWLRVWYWVFATVTTEKNKDVIDVLFSTEAFHQILIYKTVKNVGEELTTILGSFSFNFYLGTKSFRVFLGLFRVIK